MASKTASCFQGGVRFQDGSLQPTAAFGTVTSVALAAPIEITVSGSPITTSGTITLTWANESANRIFAGPTSGGATTPAFRALVAADEPATTVNAVTNDTNVTGSISAQNLTLGWTGTLAAGRLNSNVVQSVVNDTNITGSISAQALTLGWTGTLAITRGGTGAASTSQNFAFIGPTSGSGAPSFRALVASDIPSLSYVTSVALTAPAEITVGGSPITSSGTIALTWATESANRVFAGPTSGGAATPTFRALVAADISGLVSTAWSSITAAAADLTLANTTFNTTFNQTSAVTWKWANTTAATSSVSQSSPFLKIAGRYWSGSDTEDNWTIQDVVANGTNGTSTLTFTHSGTSGVSAVSVPAGTLGTAGAFGLTFNGTTIGLNASGTTISLVTTTGYPGLRFYNGSAFKADITTSTSSGTERLSIGTDSTPSTVYLGGDPRSTANGTAIILGADFGNNGVLAPTSGTTVGVTVGQGATTGSCSLIFSPTSGSASFVPFQVNAKVNQTSTASGSYTAMKVNMVETALLGTSNLLLDLQAGTTGGTSKFAINNSGVCTKYAGIATVSQGQPAEYATVDLTAQTAAIAATTLYAVPAGGTGMYRITWSATITTAGTTSILGGANGFQIVFTSPTDSVTKTTIAGNSVTSAANSTGTALGGSIVVYAKTGTNIQYQYDYTSTGTAMAYELHIKLEAL